jgi:metallo-beta-lactamase class B
MDAPVVFDATRRLDFIIAFRHDRVGSVDLKLSCGECFMKWQTVTLFLLLGATPAIAQEDAVPPSKCASCAAWNVDQKPFKVFGNTYYVGTHELSAVLIATGQGLVLIDGDIPESAPLITRHIRALGFDPKTIKLILNSHAHFDHAGGMAWLQHMSGAKVALSPWSAEALSRGDPKDDPQHDIVMPPVPPVANIQTIKDGEVLHQGDLALTAHFTPGHTPGGTSWSWSSCEGARCLHVVYADSLTPVSEDNYRFTDHPRLLAGFEKSFATLDTLPCDVLLSPHPGMADTLVKLKAREDGNADAFVDAQSCRNYAATARAGLKKRLAQEAAGKR